MSDNKPLQAHEDDDNCSEFSVISAYDDDHDLDDAASSHGSMNVHDDQQQQSRITYKESSVHESEFFDNVSSTTASTKASKLLAVSESNATDDEPQNSLLDAWNPLMLSGYVSTASVAELVGKVLAEYKHNHELLTSINHSVAELKQDQQSVKEEEDLLKRELEQLRSEVADAHAQIQELQVEKQNLEKHYQQEGKDAQTYIARLESQLDEQCRMSKAFREELDERMDELRATRLELATHRTIVAALQEENTQCNEQLSRVCSDYENQLKTLEQTTLSYYERNEVKRQENEHQWAAIDAQGEPLTCQICHCDCPSLTYFQQHMQNHNLHNCASCGFSSISEAELLEHVQNVHSEQPQAASPAPNASAQHSANASRTTSISEIIPSSMINSMSIMTGSIADDSVSEAEEAMSGFATPAEPQDFVVSTEENEKSEIPEEKHEKVPAKSLPFPSSQSLIQNQIFVCECFHAFPTRGRLISHQAHCTAVNDETSH